MRRTIQILLFAAAALLLSQSCRVVKSEKDRVDIAEEGYRVYEVVQSNVLGPMLNMLDVALKADRYLKAEDEYERYYVAGVLFGGAYISSDGLSGIMTVGNHDYYPTSSEVRLEYTDESILNPGAEWKCDMDGRSLIVRCTAENAWTLILENDASEQYGYTGVVEEISFEATVSDIERLALDGDATHSGEEVHLTYTVESSGRYVQTGKVGERKTLAVVDFATSGPVMATTSSFPGFYRGVFRMHLDADGPEVRDEDILVTLSDASTHTRVTVEYMGESSYWITNQPS